MKSVVLIACASSKLPFAAKARDLYRSDLFQKSFAYAESRHPDAVFILSAKHGLVHPDEVLEPYDLTLNTMSTRDIAAWAERVFAQLQTRTDVQHDHFVFLAGDRYRRFLASRLGSVEVPLHGLRIGQQLQWLTRHSA